VAVITEQSIDQSAGFPLETSFPERDKLEVPVVTEPLPSTSSSSEVFVVQASEDQLGDVEPKFHEGGKKQLQKVAYWGVRQVFDDHMEMMFCEYLKNSARMYFGLTPLEVWKLAYELGMKNNLKLPLNWLEKSMAGEDWLRGFLKRHKNDTSVRLPEAGP